MFELEKREIGLLDRLFNRGYNDGQAIQVLELGAGQLGVYQVQIYHPNHEVIARIVKKIDTLELTKRMEGEEKESDVIYSPMDQGTILKVQFTNDKAYKVFQESLLSDGNGSGRVAKTALIKAIPELADLIVRSEDGLAPDLAVKYVAKDIPSVSRIIEIISSTLKISEGKEFNGFVGEDLLCDFKVEVSFGALRALEKYVAGKV